MFIKIKLESSAYTENQLVYKNAPHIEIQADASIKDVKIAIQSHVKVPAERLEIRTLSRTHQNHERLGDIWQSEQKQGTSFMLFIYPNNIRNGKFYDEAEFFCFLQFFDSKENLMKASSKSPTTYKNRELSNASSITLVAISSESETETSSSSSTSTSGSSTESTDTDDSADKSKRKRRTAIFCETKPKYPKHVKNAGNISPTLCKYLDEFPLYQEPSNSEQARNLSEDETRVPESTCSKEVSHNVCHTTSDCSILNESTNSITSLSTSSMIERDNEPPVAHAQVSTTDTNTIAEKNAPSSKVAPEKRDFIHIINKVGKKLTTTDCKLVLKIFVERFRSSRNSFVLNFNENSAFELHNGELWISCEDKKTEDWLLENSIELLTEYKSNCIKQHFKYIPCNVVIPIISHSISLLEVFQLLENQNMNLNTSRWIIQKRTPLSNETDEHYNQTVCFFCVNEVLDILIDEESKIFIEKCNYKLKYCFWKVMFNFDI